MIEIISDIETIETDYSLYEKTNFNKRLDAIDFIDFHIIGRIEAEADQTPQLLALKHRAEQLKAQLEQIDTELFNAIQAKIQSGEYIGEEFKNLIFQYVDLGDEINLHEPGYDNLDFLINGLLSFGEIPQPTKALEPEMVFYQKTPARIVFELAKQIHFTKDDVFFDLGSGLGQVAILINLLTGITAKGVEFEPAFCHYATACATELNLHNVTFINADARDADYSKGTVFFMYTPFKDELLQQVLNKLQKETQHRQIKLITYGPCTTQVALQNWLHASKPEAIDIYKLTVFSSI